MLFRTPYQNDPDLRKSINDGKTRFYDMHLSYAPSKRFVTDFLGRFIGR